jgi:DNA-binding transcriptional MerR regulator
MIDTEGFILTATEVARGARCIPETIRLYHKLGLIEAERLGNGTRLFRRSVVAQVRALRTQRMAARGRRPT